MHKEEEEQRVTLECDWRNLGRALMTASCSTKSYTLEKQNPPIEMCRKSERRRKIQTDRRKCWITSSQRSEMLPPVDIPAKNKRV
jgi:hypothetical protein